MKKRFTVEVIIWGIDSDDNVTEVVMRREATSLRTLKHKLYLIAFADWFGENAENLRQWRLENKK